MARRLDHQAVAARGIPTDEQRAARMRTPGGSHGLGFFGMPVTGAGYFAGQARWHGAVEQAFAPDQQLCPSYDRPLRHGTLGSYRQAVCAQLREFTVPRRQSCRRRCTSWAVSPMEHLGRARPWRNRVEPYASIKSPVKTWTAER